MLRSLYSHPNGQIPAYEWNFSDVNPPVHAWATLFLYRAEQGLGREDLEFLERSFHGLAAQLQLVGEPQGPAGQERVRRRLPGPRQHRRLRSQLAAAHGRLPRAGRRHGVDGVLLPEHDRDRHRSWPRTDPRYEEYAFTFLEHFMWISYAMDRIGDNKDEMWDEADGFYYDVLRLPDGTRPAPQGPLDGRAAAAVREHRLRPRQPGSPSDGWRS